MIVDAHVHCGAQDPDPPQDFETVSALEREAGIEAAAMTPPVLEIYDRFDPDFEDNAHWQARRARANQYLLDLSQRDVVPRVYPLVFVWNDFRIDELDRGYVGVKWHRHPDEPVYHYDAPECEAMLAAIVERGMPVLLEEEFRWTMHLLERLGPTHPVIVPHIGYLNGGYEALDRAGVWGRRNVYTDTSGNRTAGEIQRYLDRHGAERLFFGSDYPFSTPARSRDILAEVRISDADRRLVESENFLRLIGR